ncbi:MAG: hypothetical protein HWE30_11695 [Methylocystaceae bacterium]|nr:hypothetical protein [Methylocystaceae bacterium]
MKKPTQYSKELASSIRQRREAGLEESAFDDMLQVLAHDPEGFEKFPLSDKSAYRAYQSKLRTNDPGNRTASQETQVKRNAIEASRAAGAAQYIVPEAKRSFFDAAANVTHGALTLSGGSKEKLDEVEATRQRKHKENPVPRLYQGRTPGKYVGNLLDLHPIAAPLGAAGKAAKDLEKVGTSVEGQRLGAAVMGAVSALGVRSVKLSTRKVKDYLRKKFGKNWSKRLTPQELEAVNDHLIGQGLETGAKSLIERSVIDDSER